MRALILCGGHGSRLRPITHTNAKQLIPVAGEPILFHALAAVRDAGIDDVGVVTGVGPTAEEVRQAVGDGGRWGLRVTYIEQEAPLGIAHAVMTAASFLEESPFLLYLGDNVLLGGVSEFVKEFEHSAAEAHIFLARVPEPQHFGVAVLQGDRVVRLVEKPKEFLSDLALVGIYLFRRSVLEACRTLKPSGRGEYEITEAIQWLIDHDMPVRAQLVTGYWKDTGRPEDLLEANRMMLSGRGRSIRGTVDPSTEIEGDVVVAEGAVVRESEIKGPVVIGPDCVVERSVVGPDVSMESGCHVVGSSIRDSILMADCRVIDVDGLVESILGRGVDVRHSGGGGVHRLVVGDQSRVEVD
jgi:glucose-1-phosphate thymidylyltransferase